MQQDNIAVARILAESFNQRDFDATDRVLSDELLWVDMASGIVYHGKEGYRNWNQTWLTAFPDGQVEILQVISSSDFVVMELVGRGIQTGPLRGPFEELPASGNPVELKLCQVIRIHDGRAVEAHSYYDLATLLNQVQREAKGTAA